VLQFALSSSLSFSLGGVALSTVVGIVLNLVLPKENESKQA